MEQQAEEIDTVQEFQVLYQDAKAVADRLRELAPTLTVEQLAREISDGVSSLITDLVMATGGALESAEDRLTELEEAGEGPTESVLLQVDGEDLAALLTQNARFFRELLPIVPEGPEGDTQRNVLETLIRMNEDKLEFVKGITVADPGDDDDEEGDDDDDDDDDDEILQAKTRKREDLT